MRVLTPTRRRGFEYLDAPDVDPRVRVRSHRDIALANRLFGGARALDIALRSAASELPPRLRILDVGGGPGLMLSRAEHVLRAKGREATGVTLDISCEMVRQAESRGVTSVCGCARGLPFADRSFDVSICSLLLHHFAGNDLMAVISELNRVTRHRVIVADLRRSWAAVAGLWIASFPLAFHPVSRHDGVASILRGFTASELRNLVAQATGRLPEVRRFLGFRLLASWKPEAVN
ncbi:MAG: methyltransferase domain-containing protein [Gemmatimonadota bacterium]